MTISLAFLAPELVKAAVEGRLPRGIGVTRLRDAPAEWSRQYAMLGLGGASTRGFRYRPTEYFVNAPPAWAIEFGPSAA